MKKNKTHIAFIDPMSYNNLAQYDFQLLNNIEGFHIEFICNSKFDLKDLKVSCKKIYEYSDLKGVQKILSYVRSQIKLCRIVLGSPIKLVHIQWLKLPYIDILVLVLFKFFGVKILFTAHNILPHDSGFKYSFVFHGIYRLVDGIIVHSKRTKNELVKYFNIGGEKVHVIPHGVLDMSKGIDEEKINELKGKFIKKHGLSHKIIFSFLGNISFYKGIDFVSDAWANSDLRINENAFLIIAGNGSSGYLERLTELDNVIIINRYLAMEEFLAIMRISNYLLMPYRSISQSGLLLTAIGERKKVVVSDVGGLTDPFEFGNFGYILPNLNAKNLYTTILKALGTGDELVPRHVWECIQSQYDWKNIGKMTENLYTSLLG